MANRVKGGGRAPPSPARADFSIVKSRNRPLPLCVYSVVVIASLFVLSIIICITIAILTNNVPVVYMARDLMILMRAPSITRAKGSGGGGGGVKIEPFLGPEMTPSEASAIWAQKSFFI
jgi:hypothetical protein